MSASGCERTVWRCARRPEFVHETQAEARCNYWGGAMSGIDRNRQNQDIIKAVRSVGYLEGMSAILWRLAGPEIADEAIVDYDRSVADVAELLGLEKRSYD